MTDLFHLYTLHPTYTGVDCAICGQSPHLHNSGGWYDNGQRFEGPLPHKGIFREFLKTHVVGINTENGVNA